jgi:hypothetical protein
VDGPLTPDPSPPFHGGEGRISGQRTVFEYEYEYRPPGRTEYEYEGQFLGVVLGFFVLVLVLDFNSNRLPLVVRGWGGGPHHS